MENNFLAHTGSDGSRSNDRAQRYGWSGVASENAGNTGIYSRPQQMVSSWYNSPGHRRNLMADNTGRGDRYSGVGLWFDETGNGVRVMKFGGR